MGYKPVPHPDHIYWTTHANLADTLGNGVLDMHIQSSRFGCIEIDPQAVITFARGLIGFSDLHRFVLITDESNPRFSWLQSAEDADVAFLLTDPVPFFKGYSVTIKEEIAQELHLDGQEPRLWVICNKVGDWLTGNLLGPIMINPATMLAAQIVLTEKKWTTRQPLAKLTWAEQPLAKAA
jgi:flagellar assembly factor FliW